MNANYIACCTILGLLLGNNSLSTQSLIATSSHVPFSFPSEVLHNSKDKSSSTQQLHLVDTTQKNIFSADKFIIKGIAYTLEGNFEEAVKSFRFAIRLNPNRADAYDNLGNALAKMGRLDEAIVAYRRAIDLYPSGTVAAHPYNNLGLALVNKGQWEEGVKNYCRAIRLDPKFSNPYQNIKNLLVSKGIDIRHIDIDVRKNPQVFQNLGITLYSYGQLEAALVCLYCDVELSPKNAVAYSNLGGILADLGRLEEANEIYQRAIKLDPSYGMTYNNLGNLLRRQGRIEEAIQTYRQVIKLPNSPGAPTNTHALAYHNLGSVLFEQGLVQQNMKTLQEAISSLRQATQIDRNYTPAYVDLGGALMAKGALTGSGLDEAIAVLQKALQLKDMPYGSTRTHVVAHYHLGFAYKVQDMLEEAIKEYRQAIELNPNFTAARNELQEAEQLLRQQN